VGVFWGSKAAPENPNSPCSSLFIPNETKWNEESKATGQIFSITIDYIFGLFKNKLHNLQIAKNFTAN
jgi:hypothetical protein